MTIWRWRTPCCRTKATDTHSECVILTAFPLQQWLHEHVSKLRYTYIESPAMFSFMHLNAGDIQMFVGSREDHLQSKGLLLAIFYNNHTEWKSRMPKDLQYIDRLI
jgi:hypothetical protein